ncbi:MAG: histidine kinase [Bacteroidota bacterium]|nr:histidine kinase [Bacteroidota bacterium]
MRSCVLSLLLVVAVVVSYLQQVTPTISIISHNKIDSLLNQLSQEKTDTNRVKLLLMLARGSLKAGYSDSVIKFSQKALALSQKKNYARGQIEAVRLLVDFLSQSGDYTGSLELALQNLQFAEQRRDTLSLYWATRAVWRSYSFMLEFSKVLEYARKSKSIVHSGYFKNKEINRYALMGYLHAIAIAHDGLKNMDSATYYGQLAYKAAHSIKDTQMLAIATNNLGDFYRKTNNQEAAFSFYGLAVNYAEKVQRNDLVASSHLGIARLYSERNQVDSAVYFGKLSLKIYQQLKSPIHELFATTFLSELYAKENQIDSAYKFQSLTLTLKDSLFNQEKIRKVQNIGFKETLRIQQLEREKTEARQLYNNRLKTYSIIGGALMLLSTAFFRYRINQVKHESQLKSVFTKKIYQTEMRALRAQMNPHFIFNCLNSINRYIVKSDHKTASNYLTKFARLIRLILDNSASENIPLDTEIQTLRLYIDMEKLRFDNVFDYSIEVSEDIAPEEIIIPSMLLQPYVENAIWHGLLHKENGGKLWIRFHQPKEELVIAEVEDNGIGRQKAKELKSKEVIRKKSYGMQITQDRIFLINELYQMNAAVQIEDLFDIEGKASGTKVTVEIPTTTLKRQEA